MLGIYKEDEIYNLDSYEAIKKMPDQSIDLVIIDPPYRFLSSGGGGSFGVGAQKYHSDIEKLKEGIDESIFDELCRIMKKINIYVFVNKIEIPKYLKYFVEEKKCNFDILCWHKTNPIPMCWNKYLSDTEYILFFREKGVKLYGKFKTKSTYFIIDKNIEDKRKYGHPTIKPLDIVTKLIYNSTREGEIVADFFLGSGTTAVASKMLNRRFIGFEKEKDYYEIAKYRIVNTPTLEVDTYE